MRRKARFLLLAGALAVCLAGCGSGGEGGSQPPPDPTAVTESTPTPAPTPAPTPTPKPTPTPDPLLSAVTVELTGKYVLPQDASARRYSDHVMFEFDYKNQTDKEIRGFQGITTFYDMFNKKIISINLENTDSIAAGETIHCSDMYLDVNRFMDDHIKLRDTEFEDMTMSFVPTMVVFSDGSTLGE